MLYQKAFCCLMLTFFTDKVLTQLSFVYLMKGSITKQKHAGTQRFIAFVSLTLAAFRLKKKAKDLRKRCRFCQRFKNLIASFSINPSWVSSGKVKDGEISNMFQMILLLNRAENLLICIKWNSQEEVCVCVRISHNKGELGISRPGGSRYCTCNPQVSIWRHTHTHTHTDTHIFSLLLNLSIRHSVVPTKWKVFKSGSKSEINNYRPISILPVISKITEKWVAKQLVEHLSNGYTALHPMQFGFRTHHSTESAISMFVEKTKCLLDR